MSTKKETDRLVKNGLNFRHIKKSVLYFQKTDPKTICYRYCKIRHEKPEVCENRLSIYKIYGKDYYTNNYTYNILTYKARKGRRYLHDLVKYDNYTNISWENKYKTSSPSYRYKKIIISTLTKKRFEKRKKTTILSFKGIIIQKNNPQQPAINLTKDVDNIRKQRINRPDENTEFDVEIEKDAENEKKDLILNLY